MAWYTVKPSVQARAQRTSAECWLACLEMLFTWKGKDETRICDVIDQKTSLDSDYLKKNGIAPSECYEVAKALGLRWSGGGDIAADVLEGALKQHGPYFAGGAWRMHKSHAILLTAVDKDQDKIKYINPMEPSGQETTATIDWFNDNRGSAWKQSASGFLYWL
jgi:hypothetical protein